MLSGETAHVEFVETQVQTDDPKLVARYGKLQDALEVANKAQVLPKDLALRGCLVGHLEGGCQLENF